MAREWYFQSMGEEVGPLTAAQLRERAVSGQISPDTLVRAGDHDGWISAASVKGLFDAPAASISLQCSQCGAKARIPADTKKTAFRCRNCGNTVRRPPEPSTNASKPTSAMSNTERSAVVEAVLDSRECRVALNAVGWAFVATTLLFFVPLGVLLTLAAKQSSGFDDIFDPPLAGALAGIIAVATVTASMLSRLCWSSAWKNTPNEFRPVVAAIFTCLVAFAGCLTLLASGLLCDSDPTVAQTYAIDAVLGSLLLLVALVGYARYPSSLMGFFALIGAAIYTTLWGTLGTVLALRGLLGDDYNFEHLVISLPLCFSSALAIALLVVGLRVHWATDRSKLLDGKPMKFARRVFLDGSDRAESKRHGLIIAVFSVGLTVAAVFVDRTLLSAAPGHPIGVAASYLFIVSALHMLWGFALYARGKGYSSIVGFLLGLLPVVGLLILWYMPERAETEPTGK